jgi:sigma-B regulation protein RsbU (phosphoserine phosphatase)
VDTKLNNLGPHRRRRRPLTPSENPLNGLYLEAEEIQRGLLPKVVPPFSGFEIAFRSCPADIVGGDFCDFILVAEDRLTLSIGDASGHGLPAAFLVRDVVTGIRMGVDRETRVDETLRRLNRVVHRGALSDRFVSVLLGEIEENGNFFYTVAGHVPPLAYDDSQVRPLLAGGTVLGPLVDARYKLHFAHIDHGSGIVLYTDGIIERRGPAGQLFGQEGLARIVHRERLSAPGTMLTEIFNDVLRFGGGLPWEDDATVVVIRRTTGNRPI